MPTRKDGKISSRLTTTQTIAIVELLRKVLKGPDEEGLWVYDEGYEDKRVLDEACGPDHGFISTEPVGKIRREMFGDVRKRVASGNYSRATIGDRLKRLPELEKEIDRLWTAVNRDQTNIRDQLSDAYRFHNKMNEDLTSRLDKLERRLDTLDTASSDFFQLYTKQQEEWTTRWNTLVADLVSDGGMKRLQHLIIKRK